MDKAIKSFIIQCIERARGDDLYRAQLSFKGLTAKEMNEEYGQSGQTRQEILNGYVAHNEICNRAIEAVNNT